MSAVQMVPVGSIRPSTYNPRVADPRRLDVLEMSLRKLGFILPLFADADGELLSGHQRHHVSQRIGLSHVPVVRLPAMELADRKALNIAFNRGTNDLDQADTPADMTAALARAQLDEAAAALPDLDPAGPGMFRCMRPASLPVAELTAANAGRWVNYARNMASMMDGHGIAMPLVVSDGLRVVNGIGRLQFAAERGRKHVDVVHVTAAEQALADAMLNLLSMDFDIHNRYADLLRYNSFRRVRRTRTGLGRGFVFAAAGTATAAEFDVTQPAQLARWTAVHGTSVVDFGAGHLTETRLLRSVGVHATPFEPFHLGADGEIDKAASVALAEAFLAEVAAGRVWSSVFISSVLNSVPFAADRRAIVCIAAALCSKRTRLYAVASATAQAGWRTARGADFLTERDSTLRTFRLDYEPGIAVGEIGDKPKVQKYHSAREFYDLFRRYFGAVSVTEAISNVQAVAANALPPDPQQLRAALEFEFDLPYPDGSRMGLAEAAVAAFSARLGRPL